jgi:hypothetical protein
MKVLIFIVAFIFGYTLARIIDSQRASKLDANVRAIIDNAMRLADQNIKLIKRIEELEGK